LGAARESSDTTAGLLVKVTCKNKIQNLSIPAAAGFFSLDASFGLLATASASARALHLAAVVVLYDMRDTHTQSVLTAEAGERARDITRVDATETTGAQEGGDPQGTDPQGIALHREASHTTRVRSQGTDQHRRHTYSTYKHTTRTTPHNTGRDKNNTTNDHKSHRQTHQEQHHTTHDTTKKTPQTRSPVKRTNGHNATEKMLRP